MTRRTRLGLTAAVALGLVTAVGCSATQLAWYGHTPDRRQVVEVRQRGDAQWLAVGARRSRPYRAVAADHLTFDSDGRRLAFAAKVHDRPERWTIVVDFVEGPTWDGVAGLRFGPGRAGLAYAALDGGRWKIVVDGVAGPSFHSIDVASIAFSPDGRRVGYVAEDGECARPVIDEHAGDCVARVVGLAVGSAAEGDVVVLADHADGSEAHVLVGSSRVFDVPRASSLAVDPGVRHWAVTTLSPEGWRLVVDGSSEEPFEEIGPAVWAPDGHAVAYPARRGGAWYVVAGGRASDPYGEVEPPIFSANGSRVGYIARDPGRSVVAIDGRVVWQSGSPATGLALSDDGARWGWLYREGAKAVIAIGDERYPFEVAVERTLRFSHDGRHWAALVGSLAERRLQVVVDGRALIPFDSEELFGSPGGEVDGRLASWVSAELELYLARGGGRT